MENAPFMENLSMVSNEKTFNFKQDLCNSCPRVTNTITLQKNKKLYLQQCHLKPKPQKFINQRKEKNQILERK